MGCACSRRRHSAHIRWLMTPPPCVIDRSAFLGSRSPPPSRHGLVALSAPSRPNEKAAGWLDLPLQRRYRRAATVGAVERTGAVATWVVFFFFLLKKKNKNVPCSSFSARPPAAFSFSSSVLQLLRAPRTNVCAKPLPDPLWWPGAEEARLFCDGDRPRDRYECTPVFTYRQLHLHGDGTGVHGAVVGSARLPTWKPPSLGHKGWEVWYNVISLKKKQTQTFFCSFRRRPLSDFFFFF